MAKAATEGRCYGCNGVFNQTKMKKHVESCEKIKNDAQKGVSAKNKKMKDVFHIVVQGRYEPDYWMNIEIPVDATLEALDRFLRNIWLECCGHMSMYEIDGENYSVAPMREYDEQNMNIKLSDVIEPGMKFSHEYDFGSTTHLVLNVISQYPAITKGKSVRILARNEPPLYECQNCGKTATQICSECIYSGNGFLCDECASEHECGEEMLLPVVNSPRTGVCGYTSD
jgi:predicted RNA-binding Zn-ribbon protein involved in translation (DUF1610 family)